MSNKIINIYSNDRDFWLDNSSIRKKHWITVAHRGNVYGTTLPENSMGAYKQAWLMGADMIETDVRTSSDGVIFVNHDPTVTDINGTTYTISSTNSSTLSNVVLGSDSTYGTQYLPKLEDVLKFCYKTGLRVSLDLKEGASSAVAVANLVRKCGMLGKTTYATNGAGSQTINDILAIDEYATFIDTYANYSGITGINCHKNRLFIYTESPTQTIVDNIHATGCGLAISERNPSNYESGISYCPVYFEYQHTSDFKTLERNILESV